MITSSGTTFKTEYALHLVVVRILKKQPTSSFTVQIVTLQAKPSFKREIESMETPHNKVTLQIQRFCYSQTIN